MDKDNLNINLQDWLNDPMLAAQLNRPQSATPTIYNGIDGSNTNGAVVQTQQQSDQQQQQQQQQQEQQQQQQQQQQQIQIQVQQQQQEQQNKNAAGKSVDQASTSELSSFLMNSRLNLGTLMKFVCIEFFKCNKDELANLRLIDLTQDSTFPQTLTLRNMQTENSHYKFFNTINRDKFITSCPVFAVALYSFITWKHTAISWKNFVNLPLIFDSKDIIMLQGNSQNRAPVYTNKIVRISVSPKKELLCYVFPWLPALERDYLSHDRSNYILFSLVELFNFLAKVILQDFAFLQCTGQLPHLQELIKSELGWQFLESDDWNQFKDEMQRHIDDELLQLDWFNSVCGKIEDKFINLSKDLVSENDKLSKEINSMKSQIASMNTMISQMFQTQRQLLSYQVNYPASVMNNQISNYSNQQISGQHSLSSNDNNNVGVNSMINANNVRMAVTAEGLNPNTNANANTNTSLMNSVNNYRKIPNEKRNMYPQAAINSIKRVKLDGKDMSNFNSTSRRLSQPQPQSPLQIGSPLEALLSKPMPSPKITVAMLNNSVASPPPNPLTMSPLPSISEPLALGNNTNNILTEANQTNMNEGSAPALNPIEKRSNLRNSTASKSDSTEGEDDSYRNENDESEGSKALVRRNSKNKRSGNPNRDIKYKLSRDNKTIWDLYNEWYHGLNGKLSIKELIEKYGYRRWKVAEDSHFFPTRRVIIDYIETEIDRSLNLNRFDKNSPLINDRTALRKQIVKDLETFREDNGLTLNSLSLYFRNLTRWGKEICIYNNFNDWSLVTMSDEDKIKFCKRKMLSTKETREDNYSQDDNE
ncbi:glycolytic genes transcriptional activator GCR1 [Kluyveromyces marxianus DMKU3-1042]|uniref:Glycolytic genes transcriptional activator GCR1 n=1 Tax=Kluyveromyces marxianus (strain DMKU3-1042 / BCC 29191 / NBRC 104275) TaxID=1003335 RepID=W0T4R1_KLUMD|nr:transcription regulator GCR1 [Kluyveromyces marxianus DMKU3-1042]BAO38380.1 glycolytic genes transcriptional activator GCR1 [Kluyveromyces marxianus DMKU3-1042]